ncbi:MAG: adenylate/guanylate cyclase domain-containing protein [Treponema sp.]|nr:adenylate/guanylate cyclase domain-containing protein [Treponema sp.]
MSGKRSKLLETRHFGFILGGIVLATIFAMGQLTGLFQSLELATLDAHFNLKYASRGKTIQVGTVVKAANPKVSDDILIIGVDDETLARLGLWPFPRGKHADLINAFSRIKDQSQRENSMLLDIIFSSETGKPDQDQLLAAALKESGRVYLETALSLTPNEGLSADEMYARTKLLEDRLGTLTRVSGPWQNMVAFLGSEAPLPVFAEAAAGYGHATFLADRDKIFRRQPIFGKLSSLIATIPLQSLSPDFTVDASKFERLAWADSDGVYHNIQTPLGAAGLARLRQAMQASAPKKVDATGSGGADSSYYIVREFQDSFIPSVTLSLALSYFGVGMDQVQVVVGKHVRIPSPTRYDPDTGTRVPYAIQTKAPTYDADGKMIDPGASRIIPYIDIPIDSNGQMLINFMGPPSSQSADGIQTFPIRSYSAYSERAPGPNPATWRRASMAVANKMLLVGAFSNGMSADDKQTPLGIMYGIEVHANALNTIVMDNFVHEPPLWMSFATLLILVFIITYLASRPGMPLFVAFGATIILIAAWFLSTSMIFDSTGLLLDFVSPAIAMFVTFIAIIVYRAMTEERDKQRIQATFGQYVSPDVADVLVEGGMPTLGGVDKMITVFFSDIRGFTSLSETMSPQELVNHLNNYLEEMTNIIMEYRGTLDKYVGDEIMCYWGAPVDQADHAMLACKCALAQMKRLGELNAQWPENRRINIGIGINSGIMTWANMGSTKRKNITLMGDNVNLGARLEGTNKEYGTRIIISENTYALVKDAFIVRELDNIRVKGKSRPVLMYELVDCLEDLGPGARPAPSRR